MNNEFLNNLKRQVNEKPVESIGVAAMALAAIGYLIRAIKYVAK